MYLATLTTGKIANLLGEEGLVIPGRFEWAGFVMNSRLIWEEAEGRPDWVHASSVLGLDGDEIEIESPLDLVKDVNFVEPLGRCGKKVLLWWARAEAQFDSKFPTRLVLEASSFCQFMYGYSFDDNNNHLFSSLVKLTSRIISKAHLVISFGQVCIFVFGLINQKKKKIEVHMWGIL